MLPSEGIIVEVGVVERVLVTVTPPVEEGEVVAMTVVEFEVDVGTAVVVLLTRVVVPVIIVEVLDSVEDEEEEGDGEVEDEEELVVEVLAGTEAVQSRLELQA